MSGNSSLVKPAKPAKPDTPFVLWGEGARSKLDPTALPWHRGVICDNGEYALPAVAQDHITGNLLMLAHMNQQALTTTLSEGIAVFYSRSRQKLWRKGEESGHWLVVKKVMADCDGDAILLLVQPFGPACHHQWLSCFDQSAPTFSGWLATLQDVVDDRTRVQGYTASLRARGIARIAQKIGEEGVETALSAVADPANMTQEAADLIFHLLIGLSEHGFTINDVIHVLWQRHRLAQGESIAPDSLASDSLASDSLASDSSATDSSATDSSASDSPTTDSFPNNPI